MRRLIMGILALLGVSVGGVVLAQRMPAHPASKPTKPKQVQGNDTEHKRDRGPTMDSVGRKGNRPPNTPAEPDSVRRSSRMKEPKAKNSSSVGTTGQKSPSGDIVQKKKRPSKNTTGSTRRRRPTGDTTDTEKSPANPRSPKK